MASVQAFGIIHLKNGYSFRKSAYLQWGENKESLGSFLLLNPGSAKPYNNQNLIDGNIEKVVIDPTMKQMVKLVEKVYNAKELDGRAYIYNLFSLRNAKSKDAILTFEQLVHNKLIDPFEGIPTVLELQKHPWICCGWGINSEKRFKNLQLVKDSWKTRIQESGTIAF
ncbi:DUF1643 domain-containing protein [Cytobacillus depressus]|uniref:DUF1643 domain-containing protein n=1 Tax=Cytobacillus depressus TaxID=1602942 RepID=A0A6L3V8N1_9BACI|nr:hypothetical protein [Cytobacillus depressus]KAB2338031.1 DUF1643 domain-containing protein [Cytobacillus depressus]